MSLLLLADERLDDDGAARLEEPLAAEDPCEEVGCTHVAKTLLRSAHAAGGPYWTWTRSVGGKADTRALTDEQAEFYRSWSRMAAWPQPVVPLW